MVTVGCKMYIESNSLGEALKAHRTDKGLSQKELSLEIGVARQTISSIETGSHTGSLKPVKAYLNYFNLELTARVRTPNYPQLDELSEIFKDED